MSVKGQSEKYECVALMLMRGGGFEGSLGVRLE
jgi:hypothetical protein